jgi:hypothetical protein
MKAMTLKEARKIIPSTPEVRNWQRRLTRLAKKDSRRARRVSGALKAWVAAARACKRAKTPRGHALIFYREFRKYIDMPAAEMKLVRDAVAIMVANHERRAAEVKAA